MYIKDKIGVSTNCDLYDGDLSLVYVRNLDTMRKKHSETMKQLGNEHVSIEKIHYFASLGRWCTEFIIDKDYLDEFSQQISAISNKNDLPEIYKLFVDPNFDPILPLSFDYTTCANVLPKQANKLLRDEAKDILINRWKSIISQTSNPNLEQFLENQLQKLFLVSSQSQTNIDSKNQILEQNKFVTRTFSVDKNRIFDTKIDNIANSNSKSRSKLVDQTRPNWNTLSNEHMKEILPDSTINRLIIYTDGAFIKSSNNQRAGIGVYFENVDIEPIYEQIIPVQNKKEFSKVTHNNKNSSEKKHDTTTQSNKSNTQLVFNDYSSAKAELVSVCRSLEHIIRFLSRKSTIVNTKKQEPWGKIYRIKKVGMV
ncbi:hypothetical protein BB558_001505 [Smittium angustum]|uniref:Uncharacterized protein n=1 Tax=Smittium angustum TaxID=133377 RepID=A0A2U1JB78_SMIAN|nr:hypothetical protein BB558_001505 [Smittium angustum]